MKLIDFKSLQHFKSKLDGLFVAKEKKTNSDSEYKVLSDNNLTDEMVLKINSASTITKVSAFENDAKIPNGKRSERFATSAAKEAAVESAKSYIDEEVTKANQALASVKSELEASISTKVSAAYKAKGWVAFASLPAPGKAEEGNVYNVTNAFATTGDFSEGAEKSILSGQISSAWRIPTAYINGMRLAASSMLTHSSGQVTSRQSKTLISTPCLQVEHRLLIRIKINHCNGGMNNGY